MTEIDRIEELLRLRGWYLVEKRKHAMEFENDSCRSVVVSKWGQEIYISCFRLTFTGSISCPLSIDDTKMFVRLGEAMRKEYR